MKKHSETITMHGPSTGPAGHPELADYPNIYVNHGLGTRDVIIQAWDEDGGTVELAVSRHDDNTLLIVDTAPGTVTVVVLG